MIKKTSKKAFTLVEMIMVIVILGIIGMIGTDIIAKMYQGYIKTKIVNDLQSKTELVLTQIASRLRYRIKDTVIAKDTDNPVVLRPLSEDDNNTVYDMLEWIGYDNEGFLGDWNGSIYQPGWSGFIDLYDLANTDETQISTKGSNLVFAEQVIKALSYGNVDMTTGSGNQRPSVIFKKPSFGGTPRNYGLDGAVYVNPTDHNDTHPVVIGSSNDILNFVEVDNNKTLIEQYYLAWSAYAIVPEQNDVNSTDFNLTLYYNYQPWHKEKFITHGRSSVLAEHVSLFRFAQTGSTVRIKLCIQDGNITGTPIGFCKEKAIY